MRTYVIIAAFAAIAMCAFALRTEDRVIGAQEAEADNGIGLSWPIYATRYDDESE